MKKLLLLYLVFLYSCGQLPEKPAFVVQDDEVPNEKLVCFVSQNKLREHGVTGEQYQEIILSIFEALADSIIFGPIGLDSNDSESHLRVDKALKSANLTRESKALEDIFKHTRIEVWKYKADGTYTIEKHWTNKK